jgi:hypothetical protein
MIPNVFFMPLLLIFGEGAVKIHADSMYVRADNFDTFHPVFANPPCGVSAQTQIGLFFADEWPRCSTEHETTVSCV